jgi:TonB family protein
MSAYGIRLAAPLAVLATTGMLFAQNPAIPKTAESTVVMTDLSNPLYPPLARQTQISGDVQLEVKVRQDGSIDSVGVISGHPLLQQAAVDSAKHSRFRCMECTDGVRSLVVAYTFRLVGGGDCCHPVQGEYPRVNRSGNHITVEDQPACLCDPAVTIIRVRSIKCLYLWHCRVLHFGVE